MVGAFEPTDRAGRVASHRCIVYHVESTGGLNLSQSSYGKKGANGGPWKGSKGLRSFLVWQGLVCTSILDQREAQYRPAREESLRAARHLAHVITTRGHGTRLVPDQASISTSLSPIIARWWTGPLIEGSPSLHEATESRVHDKMPWRTNEMQAGVIGCWSGAKFKLYRRSQL